MCTIFLIFNHKLSGNQKIDLEENWQITKFVNLPRRLSEIWAAIDPHNNLPLEKLDEICTWLENNASPRDLILLQGEFGATFYLVDFCLQNSLIPIYATSKRVYKEKQNSDGSISRNHLFKHVTFREYERYSKNKR